MHRMPYGSVVPRSGICRKPAPCAEFIAFQLIHVFPVFRLHHAAHAHDWKLDGPKSGSARSELCLLRRLEPSFCSSAMDFHAGRLVCSKKSQHCPHSSEETPLFTPEPDGQPGASVLLQVWRICFRQFEWDTWKDGVPLGIRKLRHHSSRRYILLHVSNAFLYHRRVSESHQAMPIVSRLCALCHFLSPTRCRSHCARHRVSAPVQVSPPGERRSDRLGIDTFRHWVVCQSGDCRRIFRPHCRQGLWCGCFTRLSFGVDRNTRLRASDLLRFLWLLHLCHRRCAVPGIRSAR